MKYENIENKALASSKRLKIDNVKVLPIFIIFFSFSKFIFEFSYRCLKFEILQASLSHATIIALQRNSCLSGIYKLKIL